ncbi:gamma subclass chorismate mutase AroQ [Streptomyces sp. LN549]|uniref:gamma subclass chorismate mutase AroQ n=1 Tax=Streptomyces sp. LN549 TaxID=3112979 RepID=UPI003712553E
MQPTGHLVRLLTAGAVAAIFLAGSNAAPAPLPVAPAAGASRSGFDRLHLLAELSARRLATAALVVAAKWGTGSPVEDPDREREVLDAVARQARGAGGEPEEAVRIFREQIEANKRVQRAMRSRWDADPSGAPAFRPDLAEVREEINRVNGELVRAIADSVSPRTAASCDGTLTAAEGSVRHHRHLDRLHATALTYALRSVCRPALSAECTSNLGGFLGCERCRGSVCRRPVWGTAPGSGSVRTTAASGRACRPRRIDIARVQAGRAQLLRDTRLSTSDQVWSASRRLLEDSGTPGR